MYLAQLLALLIILFTATALIQALILLLAMLIKKMALILTPIQPQLVFVILFMLIQALTQLKLLQKEAV